MMICNRNQNRLSLIHMHNSGLHIFNKSIIHNAHITNELLYFNKSLKTLKIIFLQNALLNCRITHLKVGRLPGNNQKIWERIQYENRQKTV